jgi:hypothetical protein
LTFPAGLQRSAVAQPAAPIRVATILAAGFSLTSRSSRPIASAIERVITMRRVAIVLALASVSLGGCFVSKGPLIAGDKAAFPYDKIVYAERGSSKATTMVRDGTAYLLKPAAGDGDGHIRLLKVADDLYVVELDFVENDQVHYLHGLLKVDLPAKTVASYKSIAGDADAKLGPGLSHCDERDTQQVCIDRLDAYIDYARNAIAAGAKPDTVYTIVSVE